MKRDEGLPNELLALLPPPLQTAVRPVALELGQALFTQGARPGALFYVVHGEVVLERSGRQGQTVVLQRVRRGFVAEASMQSSRYHCSGLATLAGQAFRLPMAPLQAARLLPRTATIATRGVSGVLDEEADSLVRAGLVSVVADAGATHAWRAHALCGHAEPRHKVPVRQ